jgi:MFS family permease
MASATATTQPFGITRLWRRDLDAYPESRKRYGYLGIVVVTSIVLYYQLYVGGAVGTQLLHDFHMTFLFYVTGIVISNAVGAFASLAAGISDRIGRANLVVYGTVITSLIAAFGTPSAHSKWGFIAWSSAAGLVEGVILVATPALVRDFSPQVGRASAMGFWAMGPVLGSLVVSEVSSHTLAHLPTWQDQFRIAGITGLVIAAVALFTLRELNAGLRDQVMVSLEEQTVLAMKAKGLDLEKATKNPYRQMFKTDIVVSALAIAMFLQIYYIAVAFFPIMFQTALGFTQSQSNGLLNWYWSANAIALLTWGAMSDAFKVRKPFMLVGAVGTFVTTIAFIHQVHSGNPSYNSIVILLVFIGVWSGCTYAPWMAGFTEMVEEHNPALSGTGLAVWGWILRLVVAASFLILPHVVNSVSPLVNNGATVQADAATLAHDYPALYTEATHFPAIFQQLASYPNAASIPAPVLTHALTTVGGTALSELQQPKAQAELKALSTKTATDVQAAQVKAPHQWANWIWVCAGGQLLFLAAIFLMAGPWSPRKARDALAKRDAEIMAFIPEPKAGGHDVGGTIDLTAPGRVDAGNA